MSTRTIYVVRHGQTEWNVARRMQGRLDSALTEVGRGQADAHGRTLARLGNVQRIVASPSGRTRDTADRLNAHLSLDISYEPALMERDCGLWSGLTLTEIEAAFPTEWHARDDDPYYHRPPDGENLEDMAARVSGFLEALLDGPADNVALVTHGVMSRVIVQRLLDLTPADATALMHPNELFYQVDLDPAGVRCAYYVEGEGPQPGWLSRAE